MTSPCSWPAGFPELTALVSPSEFRPARWLRGPHAQTILPALVPARAVRGRAETIDVPVAPKTRVRVLVTRPPGTPRGTLLLVHGLSGSAESGYMRRSAVQAMARGFAVARLNLRNCGGTESLAATLYNAGQSDDVDAVLRTIEAGGLPRPYALLGFSLGGNIAMRYAGLSGSSCLADVVAGVNPPLDFLVQPQLHHAADGIAVAVHQPIDGVGIAFPHSREKLLGFFRFGPHRGYYGRNIAQGTWIRVWKFEILRPSRRCTMELKGELRNGHRTNHVVECRGGSLAGPDGNNRQDSRRPPA